MNYAPGILHNEGLGAVCSMRASPGLHVIASPRPTEVVYTTAVVLSTYLNPERRG